MDNKIKKMINELVDEALKNSKTYEEAKIYIIKKTGFDSVKLAIRDEAHRQLLEIAMGQEIE